MSDQTQVDSAKAADDTKNTNATNGNDQDDDINAIEGLGDKGKAAIKAERDARRTAEANRVAADTALKAAEKSLRDVTKRLKDIEDKDLSESQKVAKERDDLAAKVTALAAKARDANGREAVREEAIKAGADPRRVDRIVRLVRPDLEYDEESDAATNVKKLIDDLKKSDADLFQPVIGKADGGSGSATKPKNQDVNAWLRQAAGRSSG